jgi:hypothetical protein
MYSRDLPFLVTVGNLPKSRYEIPPGYVSLATIAGPVRNAFLIETPRAGEGQRCDQFRFI